MRIRPAEERPPWAVNYSENFESLFYKHAAKHEPCWELLDCIDASLKYDPYSGGESLDGNPLGLWVYQSPPIARLPVVVVLYEINPERKAVTLVSITVE